MKFIFTERPTFNGYAELINDSAFNLLKYLNEGDVQCWCVSPPYFSIFDYGLGPNQIGFEKTIEEYIYNLQIIAERMLKATSDDGNLFFIIKDSTNGSGGTGGDFKDLKKCPGARIKEIPRKAQLLLPERLRIAFSDVGWVPRSKVIYNKSDSRRGSLDRVSYSFEEILLFSKSSNHYWNRESVLTEFANKTLSQIGANYSGQSRFDDYENPSNIKRNIIKSMSKRPGALLKAVWDISSGSQPIIELDGKRIKAKASFPLLLAEIIVNIGSAPGSLIADCFFGFGTTALAAIKWGRRAFGLELHEETFRAGQKRLRDFEAQNGIL
jgi:DNA modification methylase